MFNVQVPAGLYVSRQLRIRLFALPKSFQADPLPTYCTFELSPKRFIHVSNRKSDVSKIENSIEWTLAQLVDYVRTTYTSQLYCTAKDAIGNQPMMRSQLVSVGRLMSADWRLQCTIGGTVALKILAFVC